MTATLLAIAAAAMLAVRLGWGERGRRRAGIAGWTMAAAALAGLTLRDGAWGLAIGTVAAMTAAAAIVLYAGWRSPVRPRRAPREPASAVMPRGLADLLPRIAVFVLVVPVAFVAAQWFAFGVQAVARRGGMGEADATATLLLLQPIAWTLLMTIQMTRADATRMIAPPLAVAAIGTLLWSAS